jgi:hypothetical protein
MIEYTLVQLMISLDAKDSINYLKRNKHPNIFLQRDYNKHGLESFDIIVLKQFDQQAVMKDVRSEEQQLVSKYFDNCVNCYNMSLDVNCNSFDPTHLQIKTIIDPSGQTHEITNISEFCRNQNLHISHITAVLNNKRKQYKGWHLSNIDLTKPIYKLVSPEGQIHEFTNICRFAKEYNLDQANLTALLKKRIKSHKSWKLG